MDYTQILVKPLVSEKATFVKEQAQQVVFFVNPGPTRSKSRRPSKPPSRSR